MKKYDFIYFMGDSYTFGVDQEDDLKGEVTMDNRYSQLVANEFNLPLVNNAVPGCANDYIARTVTQNMLEYKKDGLNPLVVVCYTESDRREIWCRKQNRSLTINPDMTIYKDYLVENYDREFNKQFTLYHMRSMKILLNYLEYDFLETWSGEEVHDSLLDNTTELRPQFVDMVGRKGCFIVKNIDQPGTHRGHLNVEGNQLVAKNIINKIVELYG